MLSVCVQCVVGGTNIDSEIRRMRTKPPHILVATPGRLIDHLQNNNATEFMTRLDTFVLDEADRLLDMGFRYGPASLPCSAVLACMNLPPFLETGDAVKWLLRFDYLARKRLVSRAGVYTCITAQRRPDSIHHLHCCMIPCQRDPSSVQWCSASSNWH